MIILIYVTALSNLTVRHCPVTCLKFKYYLGLT